MKNILLFITALTVIFLQGCAVDNAAEPGGERIPLESFTAFPDRTMTRNFDGINENDPTMSMLEARLMAGQIMTVTIDGSDAEYEFNGARWVPAKSALFFEGYQRSRVEMEMAYPQSNTQDGTKTGLMNADVLWYRNESQVPARQINDINLLHRDALIEIELVDGLTADDGTNIIIDDRITTYNIPGSTLYQGVVEPGVESFTISLSKHGRIFKLEVPKETSSTGGEFKSNYRYRIKVSMNDDEHQLQIAAVAVTEWSSSGEGYGGRTVDMNLDFIGKADVNVQVNLKSGMSHIIRLDQNGHGSFPAMINDLVETVMVAVGEEIIIGRYVSEIPLKLSFKDDNSLDWVMDDNYIMINSFAELDMIGADDLALRRGFKLAADLDLMNIEWSPIGNFVFEGSPNNRIFAGMFDGQDNNIYNLRITAEKKNAALFAVNEGTIQNLNIISGEISAEGDRGYSYAAGICSHNYGTILNCKNNASVKGVNYVGGIVAMNLKHIVRCENYGEIVSTGGSVGGIAGVVYNELSVVPNMVENYNYGDITGTIATGGIVGSTYGAAIRNCYNRGRVKGVAGDEGDGSQIGGIAGSCVSGEITECDNYGYISGASGIGGIGGINSNITISGCMNDGPIEGSREFTGGIVGRSLYPIINNINNGKITGHSRVGGIAGESAAPIERCYSTGDVEGNEAVGGICGIGTNAYVLLCFNSGSVKGIGAEPLAVGGIIGISTGSAVMGSCNKGNVISTGNYVGGIIGSSTVTVQGCANQGVVSSTGNYVGGLAGRNWVDNTKKGILRSCYNSGEVVGTASGSLVGTIEEGSMLLECFFVGETAIGINNVTTTTNLSYARFDIDSWPTEDNTKGWGVSLTESPQAGYWWTSLGNPSVPSYPVSRSEPVL